MTRAASLCLSLCVLVACGDDATDLDAGPRAADAGPDATDAGSGPRDAGPATTDAGSAGADAGTAGDTWESFAREWFATYCVECHGATGRRDYRTIDDVIRDADTIRCGVRPRGTDLEGCGASPVASQFPIGMGPFPDDATRMRIVEWIDAGSRER